jgi:hypothetical protein
MISLFNRAFGILSLVWILLCYCNPSSNNKDSNQVNSDSAKINNEGLNSEDKRPDDMKKLDNYFMHIINSSIQPFSEGKINNDNLLQFGVYDYLYYTENEKIERMDDTKGRTFLKVKNNEVKDRILNYFGKEINEFKPVVGIDYKDDYFLVDASKFMGLTDPAGAKVEKLDEGKDGYYTAIVGEMNSYGPPEPPYAKIKAKLKKVGDHFILIGIEKLK